MNLDSTTWGPLMATTCLPCSNATTLKIFKVLSFYISSLAKGKATCPLKSRHWLTFID